MIKFMYKFYLTNFESLISSNYQFNISILRET
jgi:hypothetical protein